MKTIKVRIAVAVDVQYEWAACGWDCANDTEMQYDASQALSNDILSRYFIEAEIPIPETTVIQGTVTKAE